VRALAVSYIETGIALDMHTAIEIARARGSQPDEEHEDGDLF
jgi:hypothetical protein